MHLKVIPNCPTTNCNSLGAKSMPICYSWHPQNLIPNPIHSQSSEQNSLNNQYSEQKEKNLRLLLNTSPGLPMTGIEGRESLVECIEPSGQSKHARHTEEEVRNNTDRWLGQSALSQDCSVSTFVDLDLIHPEGGMQDCVFNKTNLSRIRHCPAFQAGEEQKY